MTRPAPVGGERFPATHAQASPRPDSHDNPPLTSSFPEDPFSPQVAAAQAQQPLSSLSAQARTTVASSTPSCVTTTTYQTAVTNQPPRRFSQGLHQSSAQHIERSSPMSSQYGPSRFVAPHGYGFFHHDHNGTSTHAHLNPGAAPFGTSSSNAYSLGNPPTHLPPQGVHHEMARADSVTPSAANHNMALQQAHTTGPDTGFHRHSSSLDARYHFPGEPSESPAAMRERVERDERARMEHAIHQHVGPSRNYSTGEGAGVNPPGIEMDDPVLRALVPRAVVGTGTPLSSRQLEEANMWAIGFRNIYLYAKDGYKSIGKP